MKDPLFANKVAGAILTALLIFFGLPQLANSLMGGGHHAAGHDDHGHPFPQFPVAFESGGDHGGEPVEVDLGTLLANASAAGGERRSAICKSCHTFEKGGANGTGPNLWGVVGAQVAARSGFTYSGALQAFGGEWTYERLDAYLENSQAYVPGTSMAQRIQKPEQRADLLAYLQTLADSPVAFPEPVAPAEDPVDEAGDHSDGEAADHGDGAESHGEEAAEAEAEAETTE